MQSPLRHILMAAGLVMGGIVSTASAAPTQPVSGTSVRPDAVAPSPTASEDGWIAKKSDHVCGISDLKKLSNPAKIDYQKVLDATPPMKKIQDEGIDPESPEGKALRAKAVRQVAKAAEEVRQSNGYCSIWKKIENADGRTVPDVSDDVIQEVGDEE